MTLRPKDFSSPKSLPEDILIIYQDLSDFGRRAGLKGRPISGDARLILEKNDKGKDTLPGKLDQKVDIYEKLIYKYIDKVSNDQCREALYVGLNLREGYPDSGSRARLVETCPKATHPHNQR